MSRTWTPGRRTGAVLVLAGVMVPAATGWTSAAPTAASSYHFTTIRAHPSAGHVCRRTSVAGLTDSGVAAVSSTCGRDTAYVRSASGHMRRYGLPTKDGYETLAANIASNHLLAVLGSRTKTSVVTSYLVTRRGHLTRLRDPRAHGFSTDVNGVDRHGTAVGFYCRDKQCDVRKSFVYRGGRFHDFSFRMRGYADPQLDDISDSGELVGTVLTENDGFEGFTMTHGTVRIVDVPGSKHGTDEGTEIFGVAGNGDLCGVVEAGGHERGFIRRAGRFQIVNRYGDRRGSEVIAITSRGEIGGDGYDHGRRLRVGFLGSVS